ncbi:MAG: hypothetical protein V4795_19565 [Pseudomonadota bacterium]
MSTALLTARAPLDLPERLLRRAAGGLLWAADAWRGWQLRRAAARQAWLAEELGQALLHDIGAPAWLQASAQARRDAEQLRTAAWHAGAPGL